MTIFVSLMPVLDRLTLQHLFSCASGMTQWMAMAELWLVGQSNTVVQMEIIEMND